MKTARSIPLDKGLLHDISRDLQEVVAKKTKFREGPLGNKVLEPGMPFQLKTVDGQTRTVFIRLQAIPTKSPYYAVSGGYGKTPSGDPYIVINMNGSLDAEALYKSANSKSYLIADQFYKVLIHEASHAADIFSQGVGKTHTEEQAQNDPTLYYNNPTEVRAYMQEVLDELEGSFKHVPKYNKIFGVNKGFDILLKQSNTWVEIEPYLNDSNKRRIIKAVVQALETFEAAQKVAAKYKKSNEKSL